jgi:hypothetical protein
MSTKYRGNALRNLFAGKQDTQSVHAWVSRQGAVVIQGTRDFTVKTVQKAADLAVHAGSRLYIDSASSYRALKGYLHEFVNHTQKESLNLSPFVARKIWRRRGVSPLRCRAYRLQRREPLRGLLVPMDTIFDLRQTAIN